MVRRCCTSSELTSDQVAKIWETAIQALALGKGFNWFVTVHLKKSKVDNHLDFKNRYCSQVSDFLARHGGGKFRYVGVFENPPYKSDAKAGGFNLHILLYVPNHLADVFKRRQLKWCMQAGAIRRPGIVHAQKIYFSTATQEFDLERYLHRGLLGLLRYICKGVGQETAERFKIKNVSPQGVVQGKRYFCAQLDSEDCVVVDERNPIYRYRASRLSRMNRLLGYVCPQLVEWQVDGDPYKGRTRRNKVAGIGKPPCS